MAVFFGKMREPDAEELMPAMVTVERGSIRLVSGQTPLGEWKLQQVVLRDEGDGEVSFKADDEEIVLVLQEYESFLAETSTHRRQQRESRRGYVHPAFREEEETGPGIGEELRRDVFKEAGGVADEIREFGRILSESGRVLWIVLGVLALLVIFLPGAVVAIGLGGGLLALIVGAIAYSDDKLAVKIPDPLTPVSLIAGGVVLVALGIVVSLIR